MLVYPQNSYVAWNVMVLGGDVLGRSWDHESGVCMHDISVLIKKTLESSFIPFIMWEHSEKAVIYVPGNASSWDIKSASPLILDFISLQNYEK